MKRYGLTQASITPFREGIKFGVQDLVYMQQSVLDNDLAFIKSMLPDGLPSTAIVIMNGCVINKAGNTYSWTAGNIYYNNMFYTVFAGSITVSANAVIPKWRINPNPQGAYARNTVIGDNPAGAIKVNVDEEMDLVEGTGIANFDQIRRLEWLRAWKDAKDAQPQMFVLNNTDIAKNFDNTGLSKAFTPYEGFAIMNGSNGTLDMKGRVPLGLSGSDSRFNNIGQAGGAYDTTLTASQSGLRGHGHGVNQSPAGAHGHSITVNADGSHKHTVTTYGEGSGDANNIRRAIGGSAPTGVTRDTSTDGNHSHTATASNVGDHNHNVSVQNAGDANAIDAHTNIQPYVVLGFMNKKGDFSWA